MKTQLPEYYQKYRWMVDVTQNTNHPEYYKYGGRGISCHWTNGEYRDFYNWLVSNLGHKPTVEHRLCRIDKKQDYTPGNLKWMLPKERSNSKTRQNILLTYKNKEQTLSQWAEDLNIPYWTFRRRIASGQHIKDIIKEFK